MKFFGLALCAVSFSIIYGCDNDSAGHSGTNEVAFDKTGMDTTIKPGNNFFQYANGAWMKSTVIPDDQKGWGSFYTLYESNLNKLKDILESALKENNTNGSLEQKVGDYYASGMDTVAIEKIGYEPLKPVLKKIDEVNDYKALMSLLAELNATGEGDLIGMYAGADKKNSDQNIAIIHQTGLSLPEKNYYTRTDSTTINTRNGLVKYIATLFMLTGEDSAIATRKAGTVLALETEIAKSHRTLVELRDPQKNYNKMRVADLEKLSPNINWFNFFDKMHLKVDSVNVSQPAYYSALSNLLSTQPIEAWKAKVKFDYINANAALLSKPFVEADFEFNKMLNGRKKDSDRWKKMVRNVNNGLGELLGQLYVKKYFTEAARQRMDELVNNLQKAFENRIKNLDWMDDATKQKAIGKLNTFIKKIGYPAKWKNYDDVTIEKGNFFANAKSIQLHDLKEMVKKIGQPVDRTEWSMSPPTVNAYYKATSNEIVFPAGILQFPFFNMNADDAINYGAIGSVIGHEMTHGFDDSGSQFDEKGNMQNWWNSEDSAKFKAKTGAVVSFYNAFTVLDSLHVNGQLTLGENIADMGGVAIAYDAFKLTKQGKDTAKVDGFTPDQRFFLGFAQVWRVKTREEAIRVRINTDPHSPEMHRVNGPLSNFDPFYTAFDIQEGDQMYIAPEKRAKVW